MLAVVHVAVVHVAVEHVAVEHVAVEHVAVEHVAVVIVAVEHVAVGGMGLWEGLALSAPRSSCERRPSSGADLHAHVCVQSVGCDSYFTPETPVQCSRPGH